MSQFCPDCRQPLRPGAAFCENCGTRVVPPQQPVQPQVQYPQQPPPVRQTPQYANPVPVQQPVPQNNKSGSAPIVVIILLVLVIIALVICIIYMRVTGGGGGSSTAEESSVLSTATDIKTGSEATWSSFTASTTVTTTVTTTVVTQSAKPADSTDLIPPEQINTDGYPAISTFDRPTLDEMMWVANIREAGVPAGASYLDFGYQCLGGWKCRMYFDESTTMLLNVMIGDGGDSVRVNLDWYLTWYNGEKPINDEDLDDGILEGYELGSGIYAEGDGKLTIDCFYQIGDYQYAIGSYTSPTGMTAAVGMIRP